MSRTGCVLLSSGRHSSADSKANQISMADGAKVERESVSKASHGRSAADPSQVTRNFIPVKIDSFDSYMDELFCQGAGSSGKAMVGSLSSPVRNVDALSLTPCCSRSEQAIWQANTEMTGLRGKHAGKNPKAEPQPWTSPERLHQTGEQPVLIDREQKETLETLIEEVSSAVHLEKFMTDKQTFGLEAQSSQFDFSTNLLHLNTANGTAAPQQVDFPGSLSALRPCPANEQTLFGESSTLGIALPLVPQIKADPGDLPPRTDDRAANVDVMGYAQSLAMLGDPCRMVAASALWRQAGLPEDQHQDAALSPRRTAGGPDTYSAYIGVLPQRVCFICGDEASGCHYGVLTCGSCKVFFKRAVEGHQKYLCAGRNDCIVDKIRRKNCPACRLRKCYQAGMMLGGRKLKKFGTLKAVGLTQALAVPSPSGRSCDGQALQSWSCFPTLQELRFSPQIISILENIEPEMVYSGYDNSQPDLPHLLLSSLNRLCERQLLWIVRWSKSLPGFRSLHINDQMSLIQYSWMSLMLFSLGWRSFQNVTKEYLYFAPDLVLHEDRMRRSPISELCMAMQFIPQEFANLQVSKEEFLCMKALILLNTVPLEGLRSQEHFDSMRQSYIRELRRAVQLKEEGGAGYSQRFYQLTKLMDAMHEIVKKVNLYCLSTFIQADTLQVEFPEMMSEVISSQLPKILAGMVKPLLFHGK
ncbi:LOW QUALITY PROTEIN: progesterone receptor [Brienomyrus brachyistius]|uniref:LOW QUALITY PROTEIN: progesterone receptor n=1 Tax=Brienomyrus brachyistius TaxID=42636 RepID=UPI0020B3A2CA|nr:LOW QUALITY PROTEIN: progesterone receptor [Brienomyrus brachyistius]